MLGKEGGRPSCLAEDDLPIPCKACASEVVRSYQDRRQDPPILVDYLSSDGRPSLDVQGVELVMLCAGAKPRKPYGSRCFRLAPCFSHAFLLRGGNIPAFP